MTLKKSGLYTSQTISTMKTELKRELFYSAKALCNFVNEHQITKENIQAIVEDSDVYVLFYWEVEE